jgi:cell division protein ZipA
MDATTLRIVLICIGAGLLVTLYLWERHRIRSRSGDERAAARRRAARKHARQKPSARREPNLGRFGDGSARAGARRPGGGGVMRDLAPSAVPDRVDDDDPEHRPRSARAPNGAQARHRSDGPSDPSAADGGNAGGDDAGPVPPNAESADWGEVETGSSETAEAPTEAQSDHLIVQFYVLAEEGSFSGKAILGAAEHCGLRSGDMNIFHRAQTDGAAGVGAFSMANAFTPGTFPVDDMETFTTPGVSLFAQLSGPPGDLLDVDELARPAGAIADELNGQLLDQGRNEVGPEEIRRLRARVLERLEGAAGSAAEQP